MSEADDARGRLALLRRSFEASAEVKLATFAACGDAIALAAELLIETLRGDGRVLAFAALVLAALIGLLDPVTAGNIGQIQPPENGIEWLRNLFIFTLHLERSETNRLISLAWSVVE